MPSDLRGDRISNATGTSDPSSPSTGQMYFNSSTKDLRIYNGTSWSNGGIIYGDLGTVDNPATTLDQLANAGKSTGIYYLKAAGVTFKTYCLLGSSVANSNWGLAMIIHNPTDSNFGYNGSYWSSLGELNVTDDNLDPTAAGSASLNVVTRMIDTFTASGILVTYRYRDGNYSNYLSGTSTDGAGRVTTARTTNGEGFTMSNTGTDHNSMVWDTASSSTSLPGGPGRRNEWKWNASQSGYVQSGGVSNARLGQANVAELFSGNYYSNEARGVGLRSANNCSGNSIERGGGRTNARHSAGGCGDSPSTSHGASEKFEVWLK